MYIYQPIQHNKEYVLPNRITPDVFFTDVRVVSATTRTHYITYYVDINVDLKSLKFLELEVAGHCVRCVTLRYHDGYRQ